MTRDASCATSGGACNGACDRAPGAALRVASVAGGGGGGVAAAAGEQQESASASVHASAASGAGSGGSGAGGAPRALGSSGVSRGGAAAQRAARRRAARWQRGGAAYTHGMRCAWQLASLCGEHRGAARATAAVCIGAARCGTA